MFRRAALTHSRWSATHPRSSRCVCACARVHYRYYVNCMNDELRMFMVGSKLKNKGRIARGTHIVTITGTVWR
jgi:hypothetical protein